MDIDVEPKLATHLTSALHDEFANVVSARDEIRTLHDTTKKMRGGITKLDVTTDKVRASVKRLDRTTVQVRDRLPASPDWAAHVETTSVSVRSILDLLNKTPAVDLSAVTTRLDTIASQLERLIAVTVEIRDRIGNGDDGDGGDDDDVEPKTSTTKKKS